MLSVVQMVEMVEILKPLVAMFLLRPRQISIPIQLSANKVLGLLIQLTLLFQAAVQI